MRERDVCLLMDDLRRALDSLEYLAREAKATGGEFSEGATMVYTFGARKLREIIEEFGPKVAVRHGVANA